MDARPAGVPRPRPTPRADPGGSGPPTWPSTTPARRQSGPAGQLATAASGAIVSTARFGRLLGRTGWRLARQLPGVPAVEAQAHRMGRLAATELARLLELPPSTPAPAAPVGPEERWAMRLLQEAGTDPEPLRTAMGELLGRAASANGIRGQEYLYGTIVSQLVPDEARILAALAAQQSYPAVDVIAKQFGRPPRTVLANASTVGSAAGVTRMAEVATYLTRLDALGLVEFGDPGPGLSARFDSLTGERSVRAARSEAEHGRFGTVRVARKSVALSALGREFWSACAPPDTAPG